MLKLSSHNNSISKIKKNSSSLMKSISENVLLESEVFCLLIKVNVQPIVDIVDILN